MGQRGRSTSGFALATALLFVASEVSAQSQGYPPQGGYPPQQYAPPPGQQYQGQPQPYGQPPQQYGQPPPPQYAQPPPGGYQGPPPQQQYGGPPPQYGGPPQQTYGQGPPPYQYRERQEGNAGVPPPVEQEEKGSKIPPFSIRIDPLYWLLTGRMGLELEVGLLKWLTVETVPIFVTGATPPTLGSYVTFTGREESVQQASNGLGPLSGASLGLGFWLGGEALRGYVLRAMFNYYGYEYSVPASGNDPGDHLVHTERVLMGMFGNHSRWGAFTLATGFGLGVDLNNQKRCINNLTGAISDSGCDGLELRVPGNNEVDITSGLYPIVLAFRISLGVTID